MPTIILLNYISMNYFVISVQNISSSVKYSLLQLHLATKIKSKLFMCGSVVQPLRPDYVNY